MKRQKYQNEILTRTKVKNNILRIFNQSTEAEKKDWYKEANLFAETLPIDKTKAVGIISAFSPLKSWNQNKAIAKRAIRTQNFIGHTSVFNTKANNIYHCDGSEETILNILKGNKICNFFLNILHPELNSSVTIDRHALCIALGKKHLPDNEMQNITTNQYEFFLQCYIYTANSLGIRANILQSATWLTHRRLKKKK